MQTKENNNMEVYNTRNKYIKCRQKKIITLKFMILEINIQKRISLRYYKIR